MARSDPNEPVLPSVLDRLLDDEPDVSTEPPRGARQSMRDLRSAVRRDLENLLNTRQRWRGWPRPLDLLDRSLLNYGVADLTGANLASARAREEFLRSLEAVIRRCEPRFKTVKVKFATDKESVDRTLRFRIEALLHADPVPESVVFDSRLEPVTRLFELEA
jgi:type VI secretion system protein ImpF